MGVSHWQVCQAQYISNPVNKNDKSKLNGNMFCNRTDNLEQPNRIKSDRRTRFHLKQDIIS